MTLTRRQWLLLPWATDWLAALFIVLAIVSATGRATRSAGSDNAAP
ncbi:MAG: hypothetical protein Q8L49_09770 [Burkholderiaceae bacterium]|nr:hypothetical protein [Burkholderiaceae bacterium]